MTGEKCSECFIRFNAVYGDSMKSKFPKGFFKKERQEATVESDEFDPKTCVPFDWNEDVVFRPKWIPCSEREPDKDGDYLVTEVMRETFSDKETGELVVAVESYYTTSSDDGYGGWTYAGWQGGLRVIAWQPLIKPYIEEATSEEFDERTVVKLEPEDIHFVSEEAEKMYYEALEKNGI